MEKADIYYKAMLSRDPRFDGKFYVGVKTTGIYCRPICPAKPKRENVEFFLDALSAEKAGYRPCLRCHPELSADYASMSKSPLIRTLLNKLSQNILMDEDIESLAKAFDITSRHLRRLFKEEIGATPKQIFDLHRLNFAYKLLQETSLLLVDVAFSAGFKSLRRFNDAFKKRYGTTPRQIRKIKSSLSGHVFTLHLAYRPPFDFQNLLNYFAHHQIPYIENVSDQAYERIFRENNEIGVFRVENEQENSQLKLQVIIKDPKVLFTVVTKVRKMFDLNSDPLLIAEQFAKDPFLNSLWQEFPGLRIGRGYSPFEIAVGTLLGQVVSVKQATVLMGALVKNYGEEVIHPLTKNKHYLFPKPEILMNASLEGIKTTSQRKAAIKELSKAIVNGDISLDEYQDLSEFKEKLKTIKGIGNWSAEYIALRGFGDTNAFPKDDLVLKKEFKLIENHFHIEQIAPWKAYLAIYLWKNFTQPKKDLKNANSLL